MDRRTDNSLVAYSDPGFDAFAVTPNDGVDLASVTRGIYVGGTGDVSLVTLGGTTVTFSAVPAGTMLPIQATRIKATGTTATLILGVV